MRMRCRNVLRCWRDGERQQGEPASPADARIFSSSFSCILLGFLIGYDIPVTWSTFCFLLCRMRSEVGVGGRSRHNNLQAQNNKPTTQRKRIKPFIIIIIIIIIIVILFSKNEIARSCYAVSGNHSITHPTPVCTRFREHSHSLIPGCIRSARPHHALSLLFSSILSPPPSLIDIVSTATDDCLTVFCYASLSIKVAVMFRRSQDSVLYSFDTSSAPTPGAAAAAAGSSAVQFPDVQVYAFVRPGGLLGYFVGRCLRLRVERFHCACSRTASPPRASEDLAPLRGLQRVEVDLSSVEPDYEMYATPQSTSSSSSWTQWWSPSSSSSSAGSAPPFPLPPVYHPRVALTLAEMHKVRRRLQSAGVLDVHRHPQAVFEVTNETPETVEGDLYFHGVTQPIRCRKDLVAPDGQTPLQPRGRPAPPASSTAQEVPQHSLVDALGTPVAAADAYVRIHCPVSLDAFHVSRPALWLGLFTVQPRVDVETTFPAALEEQQCLKQQQQITNNNNNNNNKMLCGTFNKEEQQQQPHTTQHKTFKEETDASANGHRQTSSLYRFTFVERRDNEYHAHGLCVAAETHTQLRTVKGSPPKRYRMTHMILCFNLSDGGGGVVGDAAATFQLLTYIKETLFYQPNTQAVSIYRSIDLYRKRIATSESIAPSMPLTEDASTTSGGPYRPRARFYRAALLGSGSSSSTPSLRCLTGPTPCATCAEAAANPESKNRRHNPSLLLQFVHPGLVEEQRDASARDGQPCAGEGAGAGGVVNSALLSSVIVDCGKTFRQSVMRFFRSFGVQYIKAVLLTHEHADAVMGLDDLREFEKPEIKEMNFQKGVELAKAEAEAEEKEKAKAKAEDGGKPATEHKAESQTVQPPKIAVYADAFTTNSLRHIFSYLFPKPGPPADGVVRWTAALDWQPLPPVQLLHVPLTEITHHNTVRSTAYFPVVAVPVLHGGNYCSNAFVFRMAYPEDEDPAASAATATVTPNSSPEALDAAARAAQFFLYISDVSLLTELAYYQLEEAKRMLLFGPTYTSPVLDEDAAAACNQQRRMLPCDILVLDLLNLVDRRSTHFDSAQAFEATKRIAAGQTYYVGMAHSLSYEQVEEMIVGEGLAGVAHCGYDGCGVKSSIKKDQQQQDREKKRKKDKDRIAKERKNIKKSNKAEKGKTKQNKKKQPLQLRRPPSVLRIPSRRLTQQSESRLESRDGQQHPASIINRHPPTDIDTPSSCSPRCCCAYLEPPFHIFQLSTLPSPLLTETHCAEVYYYHHFYLCISSLISHMSSLASYDAHSGDADLTMIPEAHPDCYTWMLRRLKEELQVDQTELTALHRRVIGEFLVGDENFRTIFLYYDLPGPPPGKKNAHFAPNQGGGGGGAGTASASRRASATSATSATSAGRLQSQASGPPSAVSSPKAVPQHGAESAFQAFGEGSDGEEESKAAEIQPQLYVVTTPRFSSYPREKMAGVSNDLLYFIRMEPEKALVPENVDTAILWGTCRGQNLLDSFLRNLRHVMVPTLLQNKWPTSIEKDVQISLHRFMATMVEDVNRLKGKTCLYVPNDLTAADLVDAHTDRELVQRYESTVIHWTRQIKEVVGEKDTSSSSMEDGGPLEEIGYWRARARDLGNIRAQLNCPDVSAIVQLLRDAKSVYFLEPFLNLRSDIEKGTEEAFDNLRFLSTLIVPCEKLAVAEPKQIPELVQDLLIYSQLILFYSKNYKKDRFCRFLCMISNEIIRRCSSKIDVPAILNGNVEASMTALEESVIAGETWISECKKAIAATNRRFRLEKGEKLDLDDSFLNEIDGFVRHRCQNLQEICRGQLQFGFKGIQPEGRSNSNSRHQSRNRSSVGNAGREDLLPGARLVVPEIDNMIQTMDELFTGKLPCFSGNKGPEIESQLLDIQRAFKSKMEVLRHLDYDILDVKATKWVDDFRALKMDIDNLTMMMQQIVTAALDSIATVTTGAEYIEAFYLVSKSEELLLQLDRSKDRVFRLFSSTLKRVQGEIQRYFDRRPPIFYLHPSYAGHGFWASNLATLITEDYNVLRHCYYLPDSPDKDETLHLYDRLDRSLRETSHQQYLQWRAKFLDRYLLVKRANTGTSVDRPALFDVNFAKELLILFEEVRYWTVLGEPIPSHITDICAKEERLRIFRESVTLVARAHNNVVMSLGKSELQLFALRIEYLDSKYLPGLNKLWWNSQGIVEYFVKDCRAQAAKVQQVVDDYKYSTVFIDHHCRVIMDTLAIVFEKKRIYTPKAFMEKQAAHREAIIAKLTKIHSQIVDKMYMLLNYFREDYEASDMVRADWHNFVERVELKVEEALKTMLKRSLSAMEKALPLESSEDRLDEKIFKLDVVITVSPDSKPDINPEPSVLQLAQDVNETCKAIIGVVRGLPRVEEALCERVSRENEEELIEQGESVIHYENPHQDNFAMRGSYFEYMTAEQDAILSLRRIHDSFVAIADKVRERLAQTWQVHQSSTTDNLWTTQKQDKRIKQGWRLEDYRINMDHVAERREGIDKQDVFTDVIFIQLDFTKMKDTFRTQCQFVISHYHRLLYAEARGELNKLYDDFQKTLVMLTREPRNLDQLGEKVKRCTEAMEELPQIQAQFAPLADKFALITSEQYNFDGVDDFDVQRCENLPDAFEEYTEDLGEARKLLEKYKEQFRLDVERDLRALISNCFVLFQQVREEAPTKWNLSTPKAFAMLESLESRAAALRETESKLQQGIEIFALDRPSLDDLANAEEQLKQLRTIWTLVEDWRKMTKSWKRMYFMQLESEKMVEGIEMVRREVLRLRRELERTDVWVQLKDDIDLMKKIIPIIDDLRTHAIRARHWEALKVQLDADFDIESDAFSLQTLLDAHMDQQADFISNLAVSAREELKIETDLAKIASFWEETVFLIEPYQGYHKISSVEEINATLAEHLTMTSSMKMSRFVDNFRPKVMQWEQTLSIVTDTIEGLLTVQTKWMYLENIFVGSDDIKRKLVADTRRDSLLEQLNTMNADLEMIQKSLEGFLEERRRVFPRFYFLSNDDLLEILGHTKEPEKVQPHLRKCFEGVYQLSMKSVRNRIVAEGMSSADGESVPFSPSVQIEGLSVEVWLRRIENKMRETVQKFVIDSLQYFQDNVYDSRRPVNREQLKKWVEKHEGQALITSSCINWTYQAELAIVEYGDLHANGLALLRRKASPIYKVYKKWKNMIRKYCQMVRQPQSRLQRNKLVSLVTIEVHSRDILRHILAHRVFQLDDFEWSRQLRFYSETDVVPEAPPDAMKVCIVRQTSAVVRYDYEYLGNSGRLVVTALTDRAYMTLTTALQLYRGGLPQGPAGTGKTETVKDLGKAIGKYVMVFNCSDGLDYKSVGRMLSGIAQTGAWSCFDEFNRIEVEVLSVVAQQILSILSAVADQKRTFLFEGAEIPLNVNCGLFVTMNPGYAGRSELPDNLKALLRPISMMVPDFTLICEITLLSEGFEESENLSKKVSILYELMEKQLSKQDHYDFSLRNIKAVLVQAGNLKRENFPGTESQLCLKAMKDMNLPKFVKDDVPLFVGMLGDLFPGVEPEGSGLQDLAEAAKDELTAEGLETNPHIVTKTLHLWDTLRTRHGVMVVGRTGSGKTVTWKTLSGALKRLKESGVEGPYEAVRVSLLNPKSVTMDELYGSYNQATREWKDGILSDLMRTICRDATDPAYKWLLFDGPVDTLWIESMNTVLDDNKMLTLNSGERISMNPTVSMLFEVQDLSQASPATVSRCGMVYFNYEDLGWQPYVLTWLKSRKQFEIALNAPKPDTTVAELESFLMSTWTEILHYKETECQELVPTTSLNAVRTFTKMFDALANAEADSVIPGGLKYQTSQAGENYIPQVKMMAMFCAVWAAGGSLTVQSRQRLDTFIRELDSSFPSMETVFEYYPDLSVLQWKSYEEHPDLQKPYRPPEGLPYYKQIVPTIDTVRYQYIISQLVKNRLQLVLVGTTGTGKSLLAKQVMGRMNSDLFVGTELNFSAQTSAKNVQDIIEGRMEHKSKKVCNPPGGRRMICLIEDLNMPSKEKFGAQPPLELLRQWLDNGYWYDRNTRARRHVNDMQLLCCLTYGRPDISERLMSKLNVFNITFPAESVINKIFSSILEVRLEPFAELKSFVDPLVKSTIDTYMKVSADLLPIPSKSHYLFNMRDLSKVFQGIYGCHLESLTCKEHMVALWVHECQRVFSDRMNDPNDKVWFKALLNDKLNNIFQTKWSNIMKSRSKEAKGQPVNESESPIFVDFWDGEFDEMAKYKLVPSLDALRHKVEEGLENYNTEPGARAMNLVFFTDALEHLCRIHRIIRLPRGNALLVGLGGSGRASLTRLAAYLAGYSVFTIEIHKKYDSERFHEDLRTLYKACGVKRQQKVFYFNDNQIMEASFLEDLNNMLSSGEVPNLFPKDDLQQIRDDVHKLALLQGCRDTPDELYNFFVDQARQHLHLVVAMSPAQKDFRARLRQFPALVSCTSIDWFSEWPNDALREVGFRYLVETRETDETDELLLSICDMFVFMHDTTNQRSIQMMEQIHRHNYVTPSSYLDLVRGFRQMLTQKRDDIVQQRQAVEREMTKELQEQNKRLQIKTAEVEKSTESIQGRRRVAEEQQTLVASEKIKIEQSRRAALADQAEALADLKAAEPSWTLRVLRWTLRQEDINEMKSYKQPPKLVGLVMNAIQTALGAR
eukprot:gene187-100_t